MRIKLNIRDVLADAWGDAAHNIPATIELEDLFQFSSLGTTTELDLDEILEQNRMIAHLWTTEDVRDVRPDLTDDQAWEVLKACERGLDSEQGLSWKTIEAAVEKLFGGSVHRIERFGKAVEAYTDFDARTNLIDWLADGLHWCRANSVDFEQALQAARAHFVAENADGGRP